MQVFGLLKLFFRMMIIYTCPLAYRVSVVIMQLVVQSGLGNHVSKLKQWVVNLEIFDEYGKRVATVEQLTLRSVPVFGLKLLWLFIKLAIF